MNPIPPLPAGLGAPGVDPGLPDRYHAASGPKGCLSLVWWSIILGGLFFCWVGYMVIADPQGKPGDAKMGYGVIALVGVPMIAVGFGLIRWQKGATSMEAWTTQNGLAYRSTSGAGFARWDAIDKFYRQIVQQYQNGRHVATYVTLWVHTKDGRQVKFREFVNDVFVLADRIDAEVSSRQLPAAIARVQNGETVAFDRVSLSRQGVTSGTELLPWSEIEALKVENGSVAIQKAGKFFNWANLRVSDIPNFSVFAGVVNALAAGKLA